MVDYQAWSVHLSYLVPSEVVAGFLVDEVRGPDGEDLQVLAPELARHGEVLVVGPLFVFNVQSRYGRVV